MHFEEKSERILWKFITPVFPAVQGFLVKYHILRHKGRQPFLIGKLKSDRTVEGLLDHLSKQGFGNHFIAWHDSGQLVSWRKRVNFQEQYHLRVFEDGEIKGHYEETPESHPIKHLTESGESDHHQDFLKFLGDWIVPATPEAIKADFEKYLREHPTLHSSLTQTEPTESTPA